MANAITSVPSAAGLHVDFYDRRRIATWINQHAGLIPWVRSRVGFPLAGWRPFGDWSSSPGSTDEEILKAAKVCSLVYSFDGETLDGEAAELPILADLAEQTVSELHGHVAELYRRQLVQKRSKWRALLPHALAHKLAKQALEDIPLA